MDNVEDIINFFKNNCTEKQRIRVIDRGIPEDAVMGCSKKIIQQAAKSIGTHQHLAEQLWDSRIHEARLLAILIANPTEISALTQENWIQDLWSWDITDQFARYLTPKLASPDQLIAACHQSDKVFTKRLAYSSIACCVMKQAANVTFDNYYTYIQDGADDARHHVRKAVVWALVEIGKVDDANREAASVFAAELIEQCRNQAWVGRNALKELEQLTPVNERRRLLSQKRKTTRSQEP